MHNILYIAQYAHYLNVAQYDNSNDDDAIGRQLHKRNIGFFGILYMNCKNEKASIFSCQ